MSASQDKKTRQEGLSAKESRLQAQQEELQAKKKLRRKIYIVLAVLVVLVVFVLVFNSNLFYNGTTAMTINGTEYTVADFNYFYANAYWSYVDLMRNTYGDQYYVMFIPDQNMSLRDQVYDSETGQTWAEYFTDMAIENMLQVTMLCDEAEAAEYEMTEDDLDAIEAEMLNLDAYASLNGYPNVASYLVYNFGKGMNEEIYRKNYTLTTLANSYSNYMEDSYTYTDQQKEDHYQEHKDEYDEITFRSYFVQANIVEDDETTEEDETVDFETAMAEAKATADEFVASITDEASFNEYAKELAGDSTTVYEDPDATLSTISGANLSDTYKDWLLDSSRQSGDITAISTGDEDTGLSNGYYVLYFVGRDDNHYNTVNGYYALSSIDDVSEDDYETDEEYQDALQEARDAAQTVINDLEEAYTSGDQTYDSFVEACADAYAELSIYGELDELGKLEVPSADSPSDVVSDWFFSDARQEGDVEELYEEGNGYYYVYYSGQGDLYSNLMADAAMRQAEHETWMNEHMEDYSETTSWAMRLATKIGGLGA